MTKKLLFTVEVYEDSTDLTIQTEGGVASNSILAGIAQWAMELILIESNSEKDRDHARRVLVEIERKPYVN